MPIKYQHPPAHPHARAPLTQYVTCSSVKVCDRLDLYLCEGEIEYVFSLVAPTAAETTTTPFVTRIDTSVGVWVGAASVTPASTAATRESVLEMLTTESVLLPRWTPIDESSSGRSRMSWPSLVLIDEGTLATSRAHCNVAQRSNTNRIFFSQVPSYLRGSIFFLLLFFCWRGKDSVMIKNKTQMHTPQR